MDEKIKKELLTLEEELSKFSNASKQIEELKSYSQETINSVNEISKKINYHLETVMAYYEKYLTESKVIFEDQIKNLRESSEKILTSQENILERTTILVDSNIQLIDKIEKVDFPSRLDKIDVSVSSITQSNLNILLKLENSERSIKENVDRRLENVYEKIIASNESVKYIKFGILAILIATIINIFLSLR